MYSVMLEVDSMKDLIEITLGGRRLGLDVGDRDTSSAG